MFKNVYDSTEICRNYVKWPILETEESIALAEVKRQNALVKLQHSSLYILHLLAQTRYGTIKFKANEVMTNIKNQLG